jgi:hypothetical protein
MSQKYNSFDNCQPLFERPDCSVLDTKGTLLDFSNKKETKKTHSRDFYTTYYRHRNLDTSNALSKSSLVYNQAIQKTIKALNCCSHVASVSHIEGSHMTIQDTSPRCKNRYCQICCRIESNVLVSRFLKQIHDPANKDFFHGKHFYFLTLTLKHDLETRNNIYLKDLRKYVSKLINSKDFKSIFNIKDKKNDWAAYQSIEMTMSKGTYHIHAHIMLVSNPIKLKVNSAQDIIKNKWLKITKDSDIIRLDLVQNRNKDNDVDDDDSLNEAIRQAASELFKYIIKSPDTKHMKDDDIDMFANWIIETKGKNFINALGYFRHNSIIKSRVKNKEIESTINNPKYDRLWIARTVDIKTNYPVKYMMSKNVRKTVLEYFKLQFDNDSYYEVTDLMNEIKPLLKSYMFDLDECKQLMYSIYQMRQTIYDNEQFEKAFNDKISQFQNDNYKSNKVLMS